jgi:ABC-type uncharacterized transport system permease subunit
MSNPESLGLFGIATALVGGAIRGSIPYMFVSLGECLTEKSGRINLGMEGILLMGAMTAFGVSDRTGSPWLGLLAAALVSGLAFFFGKQFVAPMAPQLPVLDLGRGIANAAVRAALRISPLFLLGIGVAFVLHYAFERTRWGLHLRAVGDAPEAARSMGISVRAHRVLATGMGGALAGIGGSHLTLYFPGIWSEGISGGQGLMAVALVIFAHWSPRRCLAASLLFGGAQALGPSLQSAGIAGFYHLFNASPYLLTLGLMIFSCSRSRTLEGIPGALTRRG